MDITPRNLKNLQKRLKVMMTLLVEQNLEKIEAQRRLKKMMKNKKGKACNGDHIQRRRFCKET